MEKVKEFKRVEKEHFVNKKGEKISFKKEWGGHTFTEEELEILKDGGVLRLEGLKSKTGKTYTAEGFLAEQEFKGNVYWGFLMAEYIEDGETAEDSDEDLDRFFEEAEEDEDDFYDDEEDE